MQLPVQAASQVTLAWDASADSAVAGYIINYGVASRSYTNAVTVGNVTSAVISNLVEGATYYFAAKAFDSANAQSDFSNEAAYSVPVNVTNQPPTLAALGNLTINEDAALQTVNLSGISSGAAGENQTLTITATSSSTALIPNPTVTYTSPNATGTLTFTPVANANGTATITVTVNDGQAQNNTVTRTFTVTVNAVNDSPTLAALGNITKNEDAVAQTVNLSGISSGAANESQTLTVTATSSNTGIVPNPTVTYTSPNATGTLNFTPVANAYGTATITVTVNDGQAQNNTVTRSFTVTINPVNDAPTLDVVSNVTMVEDAGMQTVNLTGISAGPSNELQALTLTATSSKPGIIPNPTVNYSGSDSAATLTFAPVANAYGTATITVTVNDGQAQSSSVTRTFNVTVVSVNDTPTLNPLAPVTIGGRVGSQTVNLTGISSGATNENQTITVTAASSATALIPNPTITYTSPNATGTLTFTPVTGASGVATLTVTVDDGAPSNNIVTRSFIVAVDTTNQPPTLDQPGDLAINENAGLQTINLSGIGSGASYENQTLTITAVSSDPRVIPNPVINYASPNTAGSLSFTPLNNTYGVASITVTVSDGQAANSTISRSFAVVVDPAVAQLTLGSAVLQTGQAGSVPVNFSSSEGVTDLSIDMEMPPGHLTNLALQALAPEIDPASATIVPQAGTTCRLHLSTRAGQSILGSKQVAQLTFTAIANQQSAFVPLKVLPFDALKADGTLVTDRPAQSGRAVVVGQESLLEAMVNSNGTRGLVLYGKPLSTFAIEYTTNFSGPRTWSRLSPNVSLNALATPVSLVGSAPNGVLYRAAQLTAAP